MDGTEANSKFRRTILAAKRAKQLVQGAKKKIEVRHENPLTTAIEEIEQGKINYRVLLEGDEPQFNKDDLFGETEGQGEDAPVEDLELDDLDDDLDDDDIV